MENIPTYWRGSKTGPARAESVQTRRLTTILEETQGSIVSPRTGYMQIAQVWRPTSLGALTCLRRL